MPDEVVVYPLHTGQGFKTEVWISERAFDLMVEVTEKNPKEQIAVKLEHYATNGFGLFEGSKSPIRSELGAYRIGHKTLFRLYGSYSKANRAEFLILDASDTKGGWNLDKRSKKRLENVAKAMKNGSWGKGEWPDEQEG
jgi:hypothetical protein